MADELDDRALTAIAAMLDLCPRAGFRMRLRQSLERSISMATSSAARTHGPRAGFTTVTPHVYVQRTAASGAPAFIEFLEAAFGARVELRHDTPEGTVAHAVVRIGDAAIEIGEGHDVQFGSPASFYLYVDDCDTLYAR